MLTVLRIMFVVTMTTGIVEPFEKPTRDYTFSYQIEFDCEFYKTLNEKKKSPTTQNPERAT